MGIEKQKLASQVERKQKSKKQGGKSGAWGREIAVGLEGCGY